MAKEYAPERGSRLAELNELFIWYALRIANSLWTLDYIVNDSSSEGNYINSPHGSRHKKRTGGRKCGGYSDGQGNTCKIVTHEGGYVHVGGCYKARGDFIPVAHVGYYCVPDQVQYFCLGVLALTK